MHWVFVNHRYFPFRGGSERHVQVLAEDLVRHGHSVTVVTSDAFDLEAFWDRRKRRVRRPAVETVNGVTVRRVPVQYGWNTPLTFQGGRRLMGEASRVLGWDAPYGRVARHFPRVAGLGEAMLASGRPDVVFAANLGLEGLPLVAADVARRCGAAFVLMPLMHLGVAGDAVAKRYVGMPHQRRLLREADLIFAMTDREAEFAVLIGAPADKTATVGVGIFPEEVSGGNGERFRRANRLEGFVVGSLGALAPDKGSPDLVSAVARARDDGVPVSLVAAGPELGAFSAWWRSQPQEVRSGTRLLGVISDAERRDMLAGIDALALPSRTESFGIVFLEAWANGLPVIAADAGAVPELVRDGVNGLIVPFGTPARIAEALRELQQDPALRARLGAAGRRRLHDEYTWPSVLERMYDAYARVLGLSVAG